MHNNKINIKEMYQLFDIYEASFELDNQLSLIKCDMLNELGLYLELREEAIIFLKKVYLITTN